jgi:hypothetical protein
MEALTSLVGSMPFNLAFHIFRAPQVEEPLELSAQPFNSKCLYVITILPLVNADHSK